MAVSTITITSGASTLIPTVEPVVLTLGTSGPQGAPGAGVPAGGTTGQILAKIDGTNYNTEWIDNTTDQVQHEVKAGEALTVGNAVYVSGATGTNVVVSKALATSDALSSTTIGIMAESVAHNQFGTMVQLGTVTGIDTSSATAGDPVWLSGSVAGGLIFGAANKPQAPVHIVFLGVVVRAHATLGEIFVTVNNGWELDELHNVKITSPSNGQVLTYDSATQLWVNSSETGDISAVNVTAPITGGGTSGAVTIGINQSALTIAESQVTNLVSDLAAKVPTSRTLTAGTGLTGGGDLTADRTFTLDNTVVSYDPGSSLRSLPLYNQKDAAEKLLAQAVFWIDAAHSSASGQTITNLGWGGSALNATAGSSGSADSNDPKFLDWTGTNYVYVPSTGGNNLTVPNSTALQLTGSFELIMQLALDDWTPAAQQYLMGSYVLASNNGYLLYVNTSGTFSLMIGNGTALSFYTSTAANTFADGSTGWVKATLNTSTQVVQFYTSTNGSTWTQLGTNVSATVTPAASTSPLYIGSSVSNAATMSGTVYKAQILNGIGGTTVLNVDTSVITSGAATNFTALTGQTVTINRATSGRKTCVVTNPLWLFGTDDYINVPDNDLLDFSATESLSVVVAMRQWGTPVSYGYYLSKRATGGYTLTTVGTTLAPYAEIGDGTNTQTKATQTFTAGTLNNIGLIVDRGANTLVTHVNGALSTTSSTASVGSLANANPLSVGRNPNGGTYQDFEGYGMAVFRRVLTTAELALIYNYYTNRVA